MSLWIINAVNTPFRMIYTLILFVIPVDVQAQVFLPLNFP